MKHTLVLLLSLFHLIVFAQRPLSLSEAKASALANKTQLKTDKLRQEVAQAQIKEIVAKYQPQLNLNTDIRYNLVRQSTVLPFLTEPVKLGAIFNPQAGLDASYSLFNPNQKSEIRQAELNYELSKFLEESDADNLCYEVEKAYLNVLVQQERLKQLGVNHKKLEADQKEIAVKVAAGLQQQIEAKRVQNSLDVLAIQLAQQQESADLSEMLLKFYSGIGLAEPVKLTDDLQTIENQLFKSVSKPEEWSRLPFYRQQKTEQLLAENQIQRIKNRIYPTISVYGYLGVLALANEAKDLNNRWYPISYAGLRVNWNLNPLWDNKQLLPQYQLKIRETQSALTEWEEGQSIQLLQLQNSLKRAKQDWEIQQKNVAFAAENLKFVESRFRSDLLTYKEVADAEAERETASLNELIAHYNYVLAAVEIRKLKGER